jgi:hypothetical protein
VHPDFVEVLMIFGEKLGPVEESFSTFFSHCHPQQGADPFSNAMCSYGKRVFLFSDGGERS